MLAYSDMCPLNWVCNICRQRETSASVTLRPIERLEPHPVRFNQLGEVMKRE